MGLDSGHMPHHKMSKALPPAYMEYVTGQLAMHTLRVRYGVIPISFSEMLAAPAKSRRALALLARGAGGTSPSLGMGFVPSLSKGEEGPQQREEWVAVSASTPVEARPPPDSTWVRH